MIFRDFIRLVVAPEAARHFTHGSRAMRGYERPLMARIIAMIMIKELSTWLALRSNTAIVKTLDAWREALSPMGDRGVGHA
jgi:hypothetical protein